MITLETHQILMGISAEQTSILQNLRKIESKMYRVLSGDEKARTFFSEIFPMDKVGAEYNKISANYSKIEKQIETFRTSNTDMTTELEQLSSENRKLEKLSAKLFPLIQQTDGYLTALLTQKTYRSSTPGQHTSSSPTPPVRCASSVENAITSIIQAYERNDTEEATRLIQSLPSGIQSGLFGAQWQQISPDRDFIEKHQLNMQHPDFGRASLLGTEPSCDVPVEKKIQVLKFYDKTEYQPNIDWFNSATDTFSRTFKEIDENKRMRGQEKCTAKKEHLLVLAKEIVPFFHENIDVATPEAKGQSVEAAAAAYIAAYPCLKPFFLKLVPQTRVDTNLVEIMQETLDCLKTGSYTNRHGATCRFELSPAAGSIKLYTNAGEEGQRCHRHNHTDFCIVNLDCLQLAEYLYYKTNCMPLLMNLGNSDHPGGGYLTGARAQEEHIFRCSGASYALSTDYGVQKENFYPLHKKEQGNHAGIYNQYIPVFRKFDPDHKQFRFLDTPFNIALGTVAAYNKPQVQNINGELMITGEQGHETYQKIRTFFHMAEQNGHDYVIACALGCGAFCNPPKQISEMMMACLKNEFPHSFKGVYFSVINDHNSGKAHNPNGNYAPFKDTILTHGGKELDPQNLSLN